MDFEKAKELQKSNFVRPITLQQSINTPSSILGIGSCLGENLITSLPIQHHFLLASINIVMPKLDKKFDLQIIQLPIRFLLSDDMFVGKYSEDTIDQFFVEVVQRMKEYLNHFKVYDFPALICNFLVPQQNVVPYFDLRNPRIFIQQLNLELAKEVKNYPNTFILDIDAISSIVGKQWIQDDVHDVTAHGAIINECFYYLDLQRIEPPSVPMRGYYEEKLSQFHQYCWQQIVSLYRSMNQIDQVKLIITDLDDTLWRGVLAEIQEEEITRDYVEGWVLGYIEALKILKSKGIALAICSKNDHSFIEKRWSKLFRLNELSLDDFSIARINWENKVINIKDILKILNILPSNAIFIDDNPKERELVQTSFPTMRVLGEHPYYLRRILLWSSETNLLNITQESRERTKMLKEQVKREEFRSSVSTEDFLNDLQLKVKFYSPKINDLKFMRAFELINKTNQFNTTGKRWNHHELISFLNTGVQLVIGEVSDRFTNYGITICLLVKNNYVEQWVMSCRVFGLGVEKEVLNYLQNEFNCNSGAIIPTPYNLVCQTIYPSLNLRSDVV